MVTDAQSGTRGTICDDCGDLRDWSADERYLLYTAAGSLFAFDSVAGHTNELVHRGTYEPLEATFSPDG